MDPGGSLGIMQGDKTAFSRCELLPRSLLNKTMLFDDIQNSFSSLFRNIRFVIKDPGNSGY